MIRHSWFNYKGVYSYDMGVSVAVQPDIVRPPLRVEKQTIPGRNGAIYAETNIYNAYTKTAECNIFNIERLDDINEWLTGYGPLIFSNEKDKVYSARILNQISFSKMGLIFDFKAFPIVFEVQPQKYSVNKENHIIEMNDSPFVFTGMGNFPARPVIDIYGNGNMVLTINDQVIQLTGVDGHITINSPIMECYKDDRNESMKMAGAFPVLQIKNRENRIELDGNFQKVVIDPNWAWI